MIALISIKTLNEKYGVDTNIEDNYILPSIQKCQDFLIYNILCKEKYNQLILDVDNDNVSPEDDTLIKDYIQPVIAYYVKSEIVQSTTYKMKNVGLDGVEKATFDELIRLSKKYMIDSEAYQQRLREYLCEIDESQKPDTTYKTGLFLDKVYGCVNCNGYDYPKYYV